MPFVLECSRVQSKVFIQSYHISKVPLGQGIDQVFIVGWEALHLPTSLDFAADEGYDAYHGDILKRFMLC